MVVEGRYLRGIPIKSAPVIDLVRPSVRKGEERRAERVPVAHPFREACQEAVIARVGRAGSCHDRTKGVWNLESRLRIEDAHRGSMNHGVLIDLRRQLVRRASDIVQFCC